MRKTLLPLVVLSLVLISVACKSGKPVITASAEPQPNAGPLAGQTMGTIESLDPRFDAIVPKGAVIEKLATGIVWAEGPVWVRPRGLGGIFGSETGYLVHSDPRGNTMYRWPADPKAEMEPKVTGESIFKRPSGFTGYTRATQPSAEPGSNGLTLNSKGELIACQHGDRRIARLEKDGSFTTVVDRYNGKRFNSPNDLCYASWGDLYFTDPPYGLPGRDKDVTNRELDWFGVYRFTKNGTISLAIKDLKYPNGIAFSPDEKTLYIGITGSPEPRIMAYPVNRDGSIDEAGGKVFFDGKKSMPGVGGFDGMKVDDAGNIYAGANNGIMVIAPDGTWIGALKFGQATANCAWGDDGSTLYICSNHEMARIRLNTKGKMPG